MRNECHRVFFEQKCVWRTYALTRLSIVACQLGEGVSMILGDRFGLTDQAYRDSLQGGLSLLPFDSLSFKCGVHHLTYTGCSFARLRKLLLGTLAPIWVLAWEMVGTQRDVDSHTLTSSRGCEKCNPSPSLRPNCIVFLCLYAILIAQSIRPRCFMNFFIVVGFDYFGR
jgi:hypothetical protein